MSKVCRASQIIMSRNASLVLSEIWDGYLDSVREVEESGVCGFKCFPASHRSRSRYTQFK